METIVISIPDKDVNFDYPLVYLDYLRRGENAGDIFLVYYNGVIGRCDKKRKFHSEWYFCIDTVQSGAYVDYEGKDVAMLAQTRMIGFYCMDKLTRLLCIMLDDFFIQALKCFPDWMLGIGSDKESTFVQQNVFAKELFPEEAGDF